MPFDVTLTRTETITVSLPDEPRDWTVEQLERALNGCVMGVSPVDAEIRGGAKIERSKWAIDGACRRLFAPAKPRRAPRPILPVPSP